MFWTGFILGVLAVIVLIVIIVLFILFLPPSKKELQRQKDIEEVQKLLADENFGDRRCKL